MPSGGARAGAGRKPGQIGRMRRQAVEIAARLDVNPLAILLGVAADSRQSVNTRVTAAAAAIPYCLPRLSASISAQVPVKASDGAGLDRLIASLDKLRDAQPPGLTIEHQAEPAPASPQSANEA